MRFTFLLRIVQSAFIAFSKSYLFGKTFTFDSFPGPLLSETLPVQNIPVKQRREITISLTGKVIRIALFQFKKSQSRSFHIDMINSPSPLKKRIKLWL